MYVYITETDRLLRVISRFPVGSVNVGVRARGCVYSSPIYDIVANVWLDARIAPVTTHTQPENKSCYHDTESGVRGIATNHRSDYSATITRYRCAVPTLLHVDDPLYRGADVRSLWRELWFLVCAVHTLCAHRGETSTTECWPCLDRGLFVVSGETVACENVCPQTFMSVFKQIYIYIERERERENPSCCNYH